MNKNGTLMKLNAISISINLTGSNIRNNKKEKAIWNGNNNSQNSTGCCSGKDVPELSSDK